MSRRTDPQATLGSLSVLLSPERIAQLEKNHWAGAFRHKALSVPLANEQTFRPLSCEDNGRPNKPVAAVKRQLFSAPATMDKILSGMLARELVGLPKESYPLSLQADSNCR